MGYPRFNSEIDASIALMKAHGVVFESGLSDDEVMAVESRFHFQFPPDLRAFLQVALPSGDRFPNWRSDSEAKLNDMLRWPEDGIAPGTRWDDIPDDWSCPDCGAAKSDFVMVEVARP